MADKITLDWNEYSDAARRVVAEGCVLLKNDKHALPLKKGCRVSVFGRIQNHYYKSGTGSGGMVNVSKVISIPDGLRESGEVVLNENLSRIYEEWEKENPVEEGLGWGNDLWSQKEMPLSDEIAGQAANESDTALVILGRTAGEDQDVRYEPGSFLLTETELTMLKTVRRHFNQMIVLLNVGGIIDMHFADEVNPDAIMYVWQGGMIGGRGTADVLLGKVSPSGKLTDTIAYEIGDYPSDANFGDDNRNFYQEDIYVGYRYFETFAKDRVRYPFGFGLSYTTFKTELVLADVNAGTSAKEACVKIKIKVENTGNVPGKEVVQIYVNQPQGKLGKALRNLVGFKKTEELQPGKTETLDFCIPFSHFASYDDAGVTGHKSCFVLEEGTYRLYYGTNVSEAFPACEFSLKELMITEELFEAFAPVLPFDVMKPVLTEYEDEMQGQVCMETEQLHYSITMVPAMTATVDMEKRRLSELPPEIPQTKDKGIKLADVLNNSATMEEFIAQLSDEELCSLVRGEGMGSARVTPGTASAFGGVSKALIDKGVVAVCCDDGPSGMRLDCGTKAFSLPNGTMIASTFHPELITELYRFTGLEMAANNVECLLGPGMNLHRHPLNGRNFEYFSEDPYVTGRIACAVLDGLHSVGVTGTIKHFCGNNQEKRRHFTDSVISERALRELYLKGFEMAVKEGKASSVMTTYGSVNGLWTSGIYDLTTTILRKQWGFTGVVMTDWWAKISERGKEPDFTNFAAMIRAQNDMYMCCPNGEKNDSGDNTFEALQNGSLTRGELQRTAVNVCTFAMNSRAMKRFLNTAEEIEILHRPKDATDVDASDVEFMPLEKERTISLTQPLSKKDTNYLFAFDVKKLGNYRIYVKGKSTLGELAQLPCTLFFNGFPIHVFTFHGSGGEAVTLEGEVRLYSRFAILRLFVGCSGLELSDIRFCYEGELEPDGIFA